MAKIKVKTDNHEARARILSKKQATIMAFYS
jgi:hypothetical protein